ncbi:hypothetical protein K1719_010043 [Acacia pycnantha]|nr:hypothetical protein K1719_010043 [Acacia pycnantha]
MLILLNLKSHTLMAQTEVEAFEESILLMPMLVADPFLLFTIMIDDDFVREVPVDEGQLVPDRKTFPSGIKALADYVHKRGLYKLGIYSDVGYDYDIVKPHDTYC